jgi:hypothetical protein
MTVSGHPERQGRSAIFWCTVVVAGLVVTRPIVKVLDGPLALRLSLGMALVVALVVLACVFVVGRLRGEVVAARSMLGVSCVGVFMVCFLLIIQDRGPVVTGLAGLGALFATAGILVLGLRSRRA